MIGQASFAPPPQTDFIGFRRLSADLAVLTTAAAIIALFAISPVTLEYFGISYLTSGGGVGSKFHPTTFLAVLAFVLRCLATRHPLRTGWRLVSNDRGVVVLTAAVIVACLYAVVISGTPVTPLIDTFVLPVLVFVLLRDLDSALVKWLALVVAIILCVNAVMAIIEFLRGAHFFTLHFPFTSSSDPTRGDAVFDWRVDMAQDWRAVALLGHPLVNGLVVGSLIMCLAAPGSNWLPTWIGSPLLLLQGASMFAFGARASLVLTLVVSTYLGFRQCGDALRRGRRLTPRVIAIGLLAMALAVGAVEVLIASGFFDRTIDRFASDSGSAQTRTTMFELFGPLSRSDLFFGPDKDVVATWQRLYGLEFGIESSWVGLVLNYGLLVTSIVVIGLTAFTWSVIRATGRGTWFVLVAFFISVSATTGLSGKTTSFAMVVILALLFLQKDERRRPLRSALGLTPNPAGSDDISDRSIPQMFEVERSSVAPEVV